MLRHSHIAGFRLPIASAGGFESQPLANFDSVRIYSRSLQLIDVQKHIRTAGVVCDKSEASVGIPHFQFPGAHPIFPFSAPARPGGGSSRYAPCSSFSISFHSWIFTKKLVSRFVQAPFGTADI
jgi:hypothetical protein